MMTKLKQCPFCGNEALEMISDSRMDVVNEKNKCRCGTPGCIASKLWFTTEQWNTRHINLEGLEKVIKKLKKFRWACVDCYEGKRECWYGIYEEDFDKLATVIKEYLKKGRSEG